MPGKVTVKVTEPLSPANTAALFNSANGYTINYAFLDFHGGTAPGTYPIPPQAFVDAQTQAQAIHASPGHANTRVGNYALYPGFGDNSGFTAGPTAAYLSGGATGVNMANPDLYPGSPTYKNPGDTGGTSTSPNIRSTLFTLPVKRMSYTTASLPAGHITVPYVNRFNNWGNANLDNDGNAGNGYRFVAGAGQTINGQSTQDQLLSRGDFRALVAHYRLRGAAGIHLLDGGVEGYTHQQFEEDAKAGWQHPKISSIFAAPDATIATLDTVVRTTPAGKQDIETAGIVFSGVYSLSQSKLALLVSNLSDNPASVSFDNKFGGKSFVGSVAIGAGEHRLLEFNGVGTQWQLVNPSGELVFNEAGLTDRNGVGVPEPMALGTVSLAAFGMLFRRRRK